MIINKLLIAILILITNIFIVQDSYTKDTYLPGSVIIGFDIGGGRSYYNIGVGGFAMNFNGEIIVASWNNKNLGIALGVLGNASVFFGYNLAQGAMSFMPTFHLTFWERFDWYFGLGFGYTLYGHLVEYGAGFSTGMNIFIKEWFMLNLGVELQGPEIFGKAGIKFKFDLVNNI